MCSNNSLGDFLRLTSHAPLLNRIYRSLLAAIRSNLPCMRNCLPPLLEYYNEIQFLHFLQFLAPRTFESRPISMLLLKLKRSHCAKFAVSLSRDFAPSRIDIFQSLIFYRFQNTLCFTTPLVVIKQCFS